VKSPPNVKGFSLHYLPGACPGLLSLYRVYPFLAVSRQWSEPVEMYSNIDPCDLVSVRDARQMVNDDHQLDFNDFEDECDMASPGFYKASVISDWLGY
jgi:hypothetical protein